MLLIRTFMGLSLTVLVAGEVAALDQLKWLPDSINGLAIVRVGEIHDSPLAKKEGWAKTATQDFVSQKALLPPGADVLVFGTEFGLSPDLPALKEYSVVSFKRPMALQTLSDLGFGDTEQIDGKTALSLNQGGFVWEEANNLWRFTAPGGRQSGLKQLRQLRPAQSALSPFLQETVAASVAASQILIALELSDAFTSATLTNTVSHYESLEKLTPANRDRVVDMFAQVRGVSLQINVEDELLAQMRVTFKSPPSSLVPMALPLLQEVLGQVGASLESAAEWKPALSENSLVFHGPITAPEVRRLLSLFRGHDLAATGTLATDVSPGSSGSEPTSAQIATASQAYFREVDGIISDLRGTLKKTRDNHALWFEKYGRKIDGLKMLNVDPDLLTFGQRVSSSFRYQGQALRVSNVRSGVRIQTSGANNQYRYTSTYVGPYGGARWSSNTGSPADAGAIAAQERASAKGVQFSEWKQIEDGLVDIRRTMTERYRAEF